MIDYNKLPKKKILCVDMKSFYASCEAVMLGLDPLTSYVAVVGDKEREGSIVLASSPKMKTEFGIKTGSRLFEIPDDKRINIVEAKMATYIRISTEITKIYNRYVPFESLHTYSIDESFLQVDGVEKIWGTPIEIAQRISDDLEREMQLPCTIGIGPNMLMAKLALDLEAKRTKIAHWNYDDIPTKLWPVTPLSKMWGIGRRLERRLNSMGIFSVGQLANFDLKLLEKKFGIIGNQLYYHAWGVDLSKLGSPILQDQISFGKSQILLRDYKDKAEICGVILEMCEEVAYRARSHKKVGRTIHLGIGYSKFEEGGGFYRSRTIDFPTNETKKIYEICQGLFTEHYDKKTVRQVSVTLSNISADNKYQFDLFDKHGWQRHQLGYVIDDLRNRFGKDALLRAVSYTEGGTTRQRSQLIGGHKK